MRSYVDLFSATGKQAQDEWNGLLRDDFGQGYPFFGFDLTPDGCDGGCFHLTRKGNLRIDMHFATALEQTVNVVVYGEFEAVLEIDKGRNIIYNYRWRPTIYLDFWHGTRSRLYVPVRFRVPHTRQRPTRGNIGSPCTWTRLVTTSTRTDISRNKPSSRILLTNIARSGRPTIILSRALYLPFVVNTASLS